MIAPKSETNAGRYINTSSTNNNNCATRVGLLQYNLDIKSKSPRKAEY
jgi:hypothetical protein